MTDPPTGISPGMIAGRILATEFQWKRWESERRAYFDPIITARGTTLYRYKYATEPYAGDIFVPENLDPNDMHDCFLLLVNDFIQVFRSSQKIITIVGDDDEEFTYGAFCTALATCFLSEADWLFEHMFGTMYCIRSFDTLEERDD